MPNREMHSIRQNLAVMRTAFFDTHDIRFFSIYNKNIARRVNQVKSHINLLLKIYHFSRSLYWLWLELSFPTCWKNTGGIRRVVFFGQGMHIFAFSNWTGVFKSIADVIMILLKWVGVFHELSKVLIAK